MCVCVQLVWLVRELVKSGVMGADGVVMTLLKQIAGENFSLLISSVGITAVTPLRITLLIIVCVCCCVGGDISTKNLWLAESVLDILLEQKYISRIIYLKKKTIKSDCNREKKADVSECSSIEHSVYCEAAVVFYAVKAFVEQLEGFYFEDPVGILLYCYYCEAAEYSLSAGSGC